MKKQLLVQGMHFQEPETVITMYVSGILKIKTFY